MIFNKQKEVKFITKNKFLLNEFPIEKYSNNLPNWFENININANKYTKDTSKKLSSKACSGMLDYFKNVYILRWNFDLEININDNETFNYESINNNMLKSVTWFDKEMYAMHTPIADNKLTLNTLKIETNWKILSEQKGLILFTEPFYDYQRNYRIIPAMIEPKFSNSVIIIIEPLKEKIIFKRGEPALAIIPLENQKITSSLGNKKDWYLIDKNNYEMETNKLYWYEKNRLKNK